MVSDKDEKYMRAALKLAERGIGWVEPNPAVGCVIVKGNQVVGRGWHKRFGGAHAEVKALEDCKTLGVNPRGGTMYVSLEPCRHYAKTGPCTEAIIGSGLAKVVVATIDPSEHANGKGIRQLCGAGIEVKTGVCGAQARLLNAPFIKFASGGKCWVTLKWAQSIDGKVAWAGGGHERRWISNERSRKDAHKLRRRAGAILVGINTVLADDPLLTARPSRSRKSVRVVLDSRLRIPLDCQLLATARKIPVLVGTSRRAVEMDAEAAERIRQRGAEVLVFADTAGESNLHFLLDELSRRGIAHLVVEGGPRVIGSFLKEGLADEICVYIAAEILGREGSAEIGEAMAELAKGVGLHYVDVKRFGDDVRVKGFLKRGLEAVSVAEG